MAVALTLLLGATAPWGGVAQADQWTGAAQPNLSQSRSWTVGGNWFNGVVPPATDTNYFTLQGDGIVTLDGYQVADGMLFDNFACEEIASGQGGPYTLSLGGGGGGGATSQVQVMENVRDTYGLDYHTAAPEFSCDLSLDRHAQWSLGNPETPGAINESALLVSGQIAFDPQTTTWDIDGQGHGSSLWVTSQNSFTNVPSININNPSGTGGADGYILHLADSGRLDQSEININSQQSYLGLHNNGAAGGGGVYTNQINYWGWDSGVIFTDRSYQSNDLDASVNRMQYIQGTVYKPDEGLCQFGSTGRFGRTNNGYGIEVELFDYIMEEEQGEVEIAVNNGNLTADRAGHRYISGANRLQEAHNYTIFNDLAAADQGVGFHKTGTGVLVIRQVFGGGMQWNDTAHIWAGVLRLDQASTIPSGGVGNLAPNAGIGFGWDTPVTLTANVPLPVSPTSNIPGQSGAVDIDLWGHTQTIDPHVMGPGQVTTYLRIGSSAGGDADFDPQPVPTKHASTSGLIIPYNIAPDPPMYYFGGGGGTLVVNSILWGSPEPEMPGPAGLEMGTTGQLLPGRVCLQPEFQGEPEVNQYTGATLIRAGTLQLMNFGAVYATSGVSLGTYDTSLTNALYANPIAPAVWQGPGQLLIDPDANGGMNLSGYWTNGGGGTLGSSLMLDGGVIGWTAGVNIDRIPGSYGTTLTSDLGPSPVHVLGLGGEYSAGTMSVRPLDPGGNPFIIADSQEAPVLLYKAGKNSTLDMTTGQMLHTYTGGTIIAGGDIVVNAAGQLNAGSDDTGGPICILNGGRLRVVGSTSFHVPIMVNTGGTPDAEMHTGSVIDVEADQTAALHANFDFSWNPNQPLEKTGQGVLDYVAGPGQVAPSNAWGLKLTEGIVRVNQMPVDDDDTGPAFFNGGNLEVAATVAGAADTHPTYGFRNVVSLANTTSVVTLFDGGLFRTHGTVENEILGTVHFAGNGMDGDVTNNVVHLSRNNSTGLSPDDESRGTGTMIFDHCTLYTTGSGSWAGNALPREAGFTLDLRDQSFVNLSSENWTCGNVYFGQAASDTVRINAAATAFDRSSIADDTSGFYGTGTTAWSAGTVEKVSTALGGGTAAGTLELNRDAGAPVTVQPGATLWIKAGAVDAYGGTDPFTDTTTGVSVNVKNDSASSYNRSAGLVISGGTKQINSLTMTSGAPGKTEVADGATLVLKDQGSGNAWSQNNCQDSLNLNTSGTLDITNHKIEFISDTETYLLGLVTNAYNSGAWNQPGITSSILASNEAVGVTDQGVTGVLVAYTLGGDSNVDKTVDVSDLSILGANYGTATGATWDTGDSNYDGAVDVSDLSILGANYGSTATSTSVPEPATLGLLMLGGVGLLARRRRS
jgi:hypothetical protein